LTEQLLLSILHCLGFIAYCQEIAQEKVSFFLLWGSQQWIFCVFTFNERASKIVKTFNTFIQFDWQNKTKAKKYLTNEQGSKENEISSRNK
jgi:hypothetical protein